MATACSREMVELIHAWVSERAAHNVVALLLGYAEISEVTGAKS